MMRVCLGLMLMGLGACQPFELTEGTWSSSADDVEVTGDCTFTGEEQEAREAEYRVIPTGEGTFDLGFSASSESGIPCRLADDQSYDCAVQNQPCPEGTACADIEYTGTFFSEESMEVVLSTTYYCSGSDCDFSRLQVEGACTSNLVRAATLVQ